MQKLDVFLFFIAWINPAFRVIGSKILVLGL